MFKMPKLYFGSRGGLYYRKKGRKVYVTNRFGSDSRRSSDASSDVSNTSEFVNDFYVEKLEENMINTEKLMRDIKEVEQILLCLTSESKDDDWEPYCNETKNIDLDRIKNVITKLSQWNTWKNNNTKRGKFPDLTTDVYNREYFLEILEKAASIICMVHENTNVITEENLQIFKEAVLRDIQSIHESIEEELNKFIDESMTDEDKKEEKQAIKDENDEVLKRCKTIVQTLNTCFNNNYFGYNNSFRYYY